MNGYNESYIEKLQSWNNSDKYNSEIRFLYQIINPHKDEVILDYGCGTGYCLKELQKISNAEYWGYDKNYLIPGGMKPAWFLEDYKIRIYDKIYLMHSFAHIPEITIAIKNIYESLKSNGQLIIITPSKCYDEYFKKLKRKTEYKPDSTVVRHYSPVEINELLQTVGFKDIIAGQFGEMVEDYHERVFCIATK